MEIKGKVHCLFEQSGVFKNEFKKLGYDALDYDIQDNFGETDHVVDLFLEIEKAHENIPSIFDDMTQDDLIMSFFPCIYFCQNSAMLFYYNDINYRKLTHREKIREILVRADKRNDFYKLFIKMFSVVMERELRMIVENPASGPTYWQNNFLYPPTFIDKNRMIRGDYYVKPTAYWFVGCEPTSGLTVQYDKKQRRVYDAKQGAKAGVCSEERSLISPDYARNFICDFILGKVQKNTQLTLWN